MFHQSQPVPEVNTDIADELQPDNGIPKDSNVSCPYEIEKIITYMSTEKTMKLKFQFI